LANNYQ